MQQDQRTAAEVQELAEVVVEEVEEGMMPQRVPFEELPPLEFRYMQLLVEVDKQAVFDHRRDRAKEPVQYCTS